MGRVSEELVTWLRTAITARMELAREASPHSEGHWWRREAVMFADGGKEKVGPLYSGEPVTDDDGEVLGGQSVVVYDEGAPGDWQFDHIAANDPQDTIARCEAELAILDAHYIIWRHDRSEAYEEFSVVSIGAANQDHGCVTCHYYGQGGVKGFGYCRTVRHLAYGYRHWSGYRETWKP